MKHILQTQFCNSFAPKYGHVDPLLYGRLDGFHASMLGLDVSRYGLICLLLAVSRRHPSVEAKSIPGCSNVPFGIYYDFGCLFS